MKKLVMRAALAAGCLLPCFSAGAQDAATIARFALGAAAGSLGAEASERHFAHGTFVRFCAGGGLCSVMIGATEIAFEATARDGAVLCRGSAPRAGEGGRIDVHIPGLGSMSVRARDGDAIILRAPSGACGGAGLSGSYRPVH